MKKPATPTAAADLAALATHMADQLAHTDIEAECDVVMSGGLDWFDLDTAGAHERHADDQAYTRSMSLRADRYLRMRGDETPGYRVVRNPAFPNLLRFEAIERTCRGCSCTDSQACKGGCWWVEADLCSRCAEQLYDPRSAGTEAGNARV